MPRIVWDASDDARLAELMQKYDLRATLVNSPVRDRMTASDLDELVSERTSNMARRFRMAIQVSAFQEIVPQLWDGSPSARSVLLDFLGDSCDSQQGTEDPMTAAQAFVDIAHRSDTSAMDSFEDAVDSYFTTGTYEALGLPQAQDA
jgi:hypothetical protein